MMRWYALWKSMASPRFPQRSWLANTGGPDIGKLCVSLEIVVAD
jgi:hypothetical protein